MSGGSSRVRSDQLFGRSIPYFASSPTRQKSPVGERIRSESASGVVSPHAVRVFLRAAICVIQSRKSFQFRIIWGTIGESARHAGVQGTEYPIESLQERDMISTEMHHPPLKAFWNASTTRRTSSNSGTSPKNISDLMAR